MREAFVLAALGVMGCGAHMTRDRNEPDSGTDVGTDSDSDTQSTTDDVPRCAGLEVVGSFAWGALGAPDKILVHET